MDTIKNILTLRPKPADYRNKHEFQAFANRLAEELGDTKNRSLYMRMVKIHKRGTIEAARSFALGYEQEPNKGRLFMWKLKQLTNPNPTPKETAKKPVEQ